jgi:hypothetical protein
MWKRCTGRQQVNKRKGFGKIFVLTPRMFRILFRDLGIKKFKRNSNEMLCREKYVTKFIVTWNKVTQECGSEGLNNPAYSSAPIPIGY